jgi:hypothetical protein
MCNQNSFLKTCLETKCTLLFPIPNSIVFPHIFIHLPFTPSMFWQLRQIIKPWFLIWLKVPYNALRVIIINHKSYLQHVATNHTPRQSLEMQFEGQLQTLQKFMEPRSLVEPTSMSSSFNSGNNMCSSTHIPPTPW